MWLSEKVTKYFKEVNIAKSGKKLQPYISEDSKCYILKPQVFYIFEILSVIVTQWEV